MGIYIIFHQEAVLNYISGHSPTEDEARLDGTCN